MNATLNQDVDLIAAAETAEIPEVLSEITTVELAYVGGGMANFSFA